jgi:hypothetical protein
MLYWNFTLLVKLSFFKKLEKLPVIVSAAV